MSKHWPRQTKRNARWLSPGAYDALSPAEKRALWLERKALRAGRQSDLSGTKVGVVILAASCIGIVVGLNQGKVPQPPATRSEPITASFGYCKWGGGTNCVVDGDTFYIDGDKVRIAGIDAPETHDYQCESELELGERATEKLRELLNSGAVTMTSIDRDKDVYGRLLRNVAVNSQDVGEAMIGAGVAREYAGGRRSWC